MLRLTTGRVISNVVSRSSERPFFIFFVSYLSCSFLLSEFDLGHIPRQQCDPGVIYSLFSSKTGRVLCIFGVEVEVETCASSRGVRAEAAAALETASCVRAGVAPTVRQLLRQPVPSFVWKLPALPSRPLCLRFCV